MHKAGIFRRLTGSPREVSDVLRLPLDFYYLDIDEYLILHSRLTMSAKRNDNKLLCAGCLRKFIGQFPDFKYDSVTIICLVRHTSIL